MNAAPAAAGPRDTLAFGLLLLGAACIGFAPVLVRVADVGPVASAFWRMALATPVLWLIVAATGRGAAASAAAASAAAAGSAATPRPAPAGLAAAALFTGLCFAADLGVWHFSIAMTTIANATLLANCAPLLVTLYAFLVHRQRPSRAFLLALALAMAGATVLVGPNFRGGGRALSGDLLALLAACFYTAYMLGIHRARAGAGMLRLLAASTMITALTLLPVAWWLSHSQAQPFWPATAAGWSIVVALALLTQVAGQGCIAYALTHLPVSLSATTLLLQPLVATLAAWLLLGERIGLLQMGGAAVLLAAIYLARRTADS
jgi:drug/metabolite transporter (DMT)-like permease